MPRPRQVDAPASAEPVAAPGADDPLLEIMPAAMVEWLRARGGTDTDHTTKAALYGHYRLWDKVRPGLPPFPVVVAELHQHCYHPAAVTDALRTGTQVDEATARAIEERVEHARRWLGTAGRDQCWITRPVPPATPDRETIERLIERARSADPQTRWSAAEATALAGALFGPASAQVRRVVTVFGGARVADALAAHLRDGSRPLRVATMAALDAPAARASRWT